MTPLFDLRKQLEIYFIVTLVVISLLYGGWRAYPLIIGPRITIISPKDGDTVSAGTFTVSGRVSHVKNIELQGRPIPIDKDGNFSEILVAQPPETIITLYATDFYDKSITKVMRVLPGR